MSEATPLLPAAEEAAGAASAAVRAIRAKMLDGRAEIPIFAKAIRKSSRQVQNYVARGMPVEYIGRTPLVVVDHALDWLLSQKQRTDQRPRGRGRPRKDGR